MDDDIDIEEHDLLENPTIKSIFPDLSILKEEISVYSVDATDIKPVDAKNVIDENNTSIKCNENDEIYDISVNSDSEPEICFVMKRQPPHHSNKIILGSKPALQQYKIEVDTENITEKIYSASVVLDDISLELRKSGRFCETCLILFPRIETLQGHQVKCHHNTIDELKTKNQVELVTYKCEKCCKRFLRHGNWIKHVQNKHKMRIVSRVQSESKYRMLRSYRRVIRPTKINCGSENECFHCNKQFSSKKLLIEHIYTTIRSNNRLAKSKLFINNSENIIKFKCKGSKINRQKNTISSAENRVQQSSSKRSANDTVTTQLRSTKSSVKNIVKINNEILPNPLEMSVQLNKSFENANEKTTSTCCETINKEHKAERKKLFYRCLYCSYYFRKLMFYWKHIHKKHKDTSKPKVNMVLFDGQCKYCSTKVLDLKSYNVHMIQSHKKIINNTFKIYPKVVLSKVEINKSKTFKPGRTAPVKKSSNYNELLNMELSELSENIRNDDLGENSSELNLLVLKSKLFKCMRCDIHFLTVQSTRDHENHMEMLINWKCHVCHKIFKKEDEISHQKQHEFANSFTVFELDAHELKRVLYKCSKCAIHFNEDDYISHFKTCEVVMAESMYCKSCDILIDKCLYGDHSDDHRYKRLNPIDFTIINTDDIISTDNYITTVETPHVIVNSKRKRITTSNRIQKRGAKKRVLKKKIDFWNTIYLKLSYCDTCKSFVTQIGLIRSVHVESRCAHMKTVVCKYCGLVFTANSMRKHIKGVHQQRKNLKLQDFSFYSIRTGKPILPPVPEYPKCYKCDVHFISRNDVFGHVCSEYNFLTCNICNIKLYDTIFKLHMAFHYYSKSLDNNFLSDISNGSKNKEKYHQKPITTKRKKQLPNTGLTTGIQESGATLGSKINIELNETLDSQKTTEINERVNKGDTSKDMPDANVMPNVSKENEQNKIKETTFVASNKKSDYELFNVLYCCANCHITIDTYDSVVEHCQDHLCGVEVKTEICKICKMTVDHKSFRDHYIFHNLLGIRAPLTLLKFDIFYFTLGNKLWLKHVFGPFSERKTKLILYRSIYNTCRIKMEVIQEGSPDLTVYKCVSCHVIVEPDTVVKHAETSCFRTRKYPCAYCGLPFLSYLARREHENIHLTNNVTLKSYRIVAFNHNNDKKDNKMLTKRQLNYVLYQCRNCRGIIDKYQRTIHECIKTNLKKCESCGLLIPSSDYNAHFRKHKDVPNFSQKNMKIVLFGQNDQSKTSDENGQNSNCFDGIFIDYTFYQCVNCEVCFEKSQLSRLNHDVCYDNSLKMKCVKCDLYILKKKMFQHNKMHEVHVDFVREHMNIIPYSASELQAKFIPADTYGTQGNSNNVSLLQSTSQEEEVVQRSNINVLGDSEKPSLEYEKGNNSKIEERTAKLFKCVCGLHFLDHSSIKVHLDHCHSKIAKQHCSKCRLLFTPNVLFDHLLIHHGDKKYKYDFKIIEMSKKQCDVVTLYSCVKCTTHFVEYEKAKAHYEICDEMDEESKKCKKCNLFFDICSIDQHESSHHESNVADMDIVDIEKYLLLRNLHSDRKNQNNIVQNTSLNGDGVIDKRKYNISDDFLAGIDLSKYNNCIYKCELCNTNFLTENTHSRHFSNGHNLSPQDTCHICGLRFALPSLSKHIYIHHKQMKLSFIDDFVFKYH